MKITAQQYAKSLYEATKDKSQSEIDVVLRNFVKVLAKNNQLKLKTSIADKLKDIYDQENGIVEAHVTSRDELSDVLRSMLRSKISTKYRAKEVVLVEKIDPKIKGGIVIRVGDDVMDGSVRRKLEELKNNLSK